MSGIVWRPEDDPKIRPPLHEGEVYRPDILNVIETSIDGLSNELRALSLDIRGSNRPSQQGFLSISTQPTLTHVQKITQSSSSKKGTSWISIHDSCPECRRRYAHDAYTAFMEKHGFVVTRHYHLETAWVATYTHGLGGRVLGVNSEMDALPGIGHACGHNLVGISGVAVALAAKAASFPPILLIQSFLPWMCWYQQKQVREEAVLTLLLCRPWRVAHGTAPRCVQLCSNVHTLGAIR